MATIEYDDYGRMWTRLPKLSCGKYWQGCNSTKLYCDFCPLPLLKPAICHSIWRTSMTFASQCWIFYASNWIYPEAEGFWYEMIDKMLYWRQSSCQLLSCSCANSSIILMFVSIIDSQLGKQTSKQQSHERIDSLPFKYSFSMHI